FVAELPEVQLQRLQLDAALVRHVDDADCGEVRLARDGAHRGELGADVLNLVRAMRVGVGEDLEGLLVRGGHTARSWVMCRDYTSRPRGRMDNECETDCCVPPFGPYREQRSARGFAPPGVARGRTHPTEVSCPD